MSAIVPQSSAAVSGISSFDFHGHSAAVYEDERGHWVFVNQLCGFMGLGTRSQRKRIERSCWSEGWRVIMTLQVPGDTQSREHFLLHQRRLPMWLGSIDTTRISNPEVHARVKDHQIEFADALADYLYEGGVVNPRASADQLAALEERITEQAAAIQALTPDAHAYRTLIASKLGYDMQTAANILNQDPNIHTGRNRLFAKLRGMGVLMKNNKPYACKNKLAVEQPDEHPLVTRHHYAGYYDHAEDVLRRGKSQTLLTFEGLKRMHVELGGTVSPAKR